MGQFKLPCIAEGRIWLWVSALSWGCYIALWNQFTSNLLTYLKSLSYNLNILKKSEREHKHPNESRGMVLWGLMNHSRRPLFGHCCHCTGHPTFCWDSVAKNTQNASAQLTWHTPTAPEDVVYSRCSSERNVAVYRPPNSLWGLQEHGNQLLPRQQTISNTCRTLLVFNFN